MKRSARMSRITNLSRTAERIAGEAFAAAEREVATQEAELRSLRQYQAEYLTKLDYGAALASYDVQKLRAFVRRIDEGIAALEHRVRAAARRCERERERLIAEKRRADALNDVTARALTSEARALEGKVQREIDDSPREKPVQG